MNLKLISPLLLCLFSSKSLFAGSSSHAQTHTQAAWSQADAIYGESEMAEARHHVKAHHGSETQSLFMFDRLEYIFDDADQFIWDWQGWIGGDINKLWVKSEGEYDVDESGLHEAEIQLLWSHAISRFFDAQAGLRFDIEPDQTVHAVIGLQGLAPYWFETDAALFISEEGDLTASLELEYEVLLTQRLILQPRMEVAASAQDIPEKGLGAGISSAAIGARLRYEITREFAPYLGLEWTSLIGNTRHFTDEKKQDLHFMIGVRLWY